MRCPKCGEYVHQGENPGVLLNPATQEAHKCNPANLRVPAGMWRGYTYAEMAKLWDNRRKKTAAELNKIQELSRQHDEPDVD